MGYATEAVEDVTAMPGMPAQPKVPVWVTDDRWGAWHAWLPKDTMTMSGRALTACGFEWFWSATVTASYQIMADAACSNCLLVTTGEAYQRGRGARRRLPQGPLPPRTPGKPGRPRKIVDDIKAPLPLAGMTEDEIRLVEERLTEDSNEVLELDFTFEVGRALPSWACIQCGTTLAAGDRVCSTWCQRERIEEEREDRRERDGLIMARRHFIDQLYGHRRRDSIRSWTPPRRQIDRPVTAL